MKNHTQAGLIALFMAAILFLSGCEATNNLTGNIEIREEISADGNASGSMSIYLDMTSLYLAAQVPEASYPQFDAVLKKSFCENASASFNLTKDAKCDVNNAIFTLSGNKTNSDHLLNKTDGLYKKSGLLYVEYLFAPNSSSLGGASGAAPNLSQLPQGLKSKLTIEMPGEIFEVIGGKITTENYGKKVAEFNFLEVLAKGTPISVRSRHMNGPVLSIITLLLLLLTIAMPIIRTLMNRKQADSLYKDSPNTILYAVLMLFVIIPGFYWTSYMFFYASSIEMRITPLIWAFVYNLGFIVFTALYLGTDFEVTKNGIIYKKFFVKKIIPFSQIKNIERAKIESRFTFKLLVKTYITPSGAKVQPTDIVNNLRGGLRKGILIFLKDGRTILYPVRDIDWVIDAVKSRVR